MFGILFILVGLAFDLVADSLFHRAGTTVMPYAESQKLITSGVFRVSSNPMYLGFALILLGAAAMFGTLSPFLVVPAFMLLTWRQFIRTEEKMLEEKFGPAYLDYKKKVRRWI